MGPSLLLQDALEETYSDVRNLIFKTTHEFSRNYGVEFEELIGESNLAFLRAYFSYSREYPFPAWVRFRVWKALLETARMRSKKTSRMTQVDYDLRKVPERTNSSFQMVDFLDELSEDAQFVVSLALDGPADIELNLYQRGHVNGRNIRAAIREFLYDIGWAAERVTQSFSEIGKAIA